MKLLRKRERGEGMVSYLIVLALVVLVSVGVATTLGDSIKGLFTKANNKVVKVGEKMDAVDQPEAGQK